MIILTDIVVYDKEGNDLDRYTVIISDSVYSMSENAHSPQGVNLYCGERNEFPEDVSHFGKIVDFESLPDGVKYAIKDRCPPDQ